MAPALTLLLSCALVLIIVPLFVSSQMMAEDESPCTTNICENGATCVSKRGFYTCVCAAGFTGKRCQYSKDINLSSDGELSDRVDRLEDAVHSAIYSAMGAMEQNMGRFIEHMMTQMDTAISAMQNNPNGTLPNLSRPYRYQRQNRWTNYDDDDDDSDSSDDDDDDDDRSDDTSANPWSSSFRRDISGTARGIRNWMDNRGQPCWGRQCPLSGSGAAGYGRRGRGGYHRGYHRGSGPHHMNGRMGPGYHHEWTWPSATAAPDGGDINTWKPIRRGWRNNDGGDPSVAAQNTGRRLGQ